MNFYHLVDHYSISPTQESVAALRREVQRIQLLEVVAVRTEEIVTAVNESYSLFVSGHSFNFSRS